jgi:Cu(I)/Ag(I) efflux system membrane fusion protein
MSDDLPRIAHELDGNGVSPRPRDEGGLHAPPGLGPLGRVWWWVRFTLRVNAARLRFIAVLLAVGAVIAYWDTLHAYYEKWTRPAAGHAAVSADLEFWCPMHPAVVRDHPDKCPICGMPLSPRKKGDKGEEDPLPPGVISRVQLTPYRVALAGIQTSMVGYEPLKKEIRTVGFVEFDERKLSRITARVTGKSRIDKLYVNVTGQMVHAGDPVAELYSPDLVVTVQNLLDAKASGNPALERMARDRLTLWGISDDQVNAIVKTGKPVTHVTIRAPISGHVIKKYQVEGEYVEEGARLFDMADLSTVWIEAQVYEDELAFLKEGLEVAATTKAFPGRTFRGTVAFVHPHLDAATRTLRVRFDMANPHHDLRPGMYATVVLEVPVVQLETFAKVLADDWSTDVLADGVARAWSGSALPFASAGAGPLLRASLSRAVAAQGLVLAVPESAVIDTGSRKVVYRQAESGVYEGVVVQLGPRAGGFYPVLHGLEPGERVATAGSFLIDAETRLTGGLGSIYFGASGGPQADKHAGAAVRPSMTDDEDGKVKAGLAKLSAEDRKLAEAQRLCPVLKSRLGSMGRPIKLLLNGQPVFLCCKGCEAEARANPEKTLNTVRELKAGKAGDGAAPATPARLDAEEAKIQAELAKLSPGDRALAEAQRFCAVQTKNRLGSMGVPVKIVLRGLPVFLCCDGCVGPARDDADATLATVEKLKAKSR